MKPLVNLLIKSDIRGVLTAQFSSYIHNLSTAYPRPVTIITENDNRQSSIIKVLGNDKDYEYTYKVSDNLWLATEERTIIDMLRFPTYEQFLFESLEEYKEINEDLSLLRKVAEHYNVTDKLEKALEEVDEWMDDFYNHS